MRIRLFALSLLLGFWVGTPQNAKAEEIRIETNNLSVRLGNDGRISINSAQRLANPRFRSSLIRPLNLGYESQTLRDSIYQNLNITPSRLGSSGMACERDSRQYQSIQQSSNGRSYTHSAIATQICQ